MHRYKAYSPPVRLREQWRLSGDVEINIPPPKYILRYLNVVEAAAASYVEARVSVLQPSCLDRLNTHSWVMKHPHRAVYVKSDYCIPRAFHALLEFDAYLHDAPSFHPLPLLFLSLLADAQGL